MAFSSKFLEFENGNSLKGSYRFEVEPDMNFMMKKLRETAVLTQVIM